MSLAFFNFRGKKKLEKQGWLGLFYDETPQWGNVCGVHGW